MYWKFTVKSCVCVKSTYNYECQNKQSHNNATITLTVIYCYMNLTSDKNVDESNYCYMSKNDKHAF